GPAALADRARRRRSRCAAAPGLCGNRPRHRRAARVAAHAAAHVARPRTSAEGAAMMNMRPPRLATRLLNALLPRGVEGATIRGDLLEEYAARATRSRSSAAMWYWRTVFSVLLRYRRTPGRERQSARSRVETLVQDLRFALRGWRRAPGFT